MLPYFLITETHQNTGQPINHPENKWINKQTLRRKEETCQLRLAKCKTELNESAATLRRHQLKNNY